MKDNKKIILIIICALLSVGFLIYAIFYAIKHKDDGEVLSTNKVKINLTSNGQLDVVTMPTPNENITLKSLPETPSTLNEIDFNTMIKLFKTTKKSILSLVKDNCSYCQDYEPKMIDALNDNNVKAYKLNISKLSSSELTKLFNYVDFTGTPTTYIIEDGKVSHSFSGTSDKENLSAFVEYFYVRSN